MPVTLRLSTKYLISPANVELRVGLIGHSNVKVIIILLVVTATFGVRAYQSYHLLICPAYLKSLLFIHFKTAIFYGFWPLSFAVGLVFSVWLYYSYLLVLCQVISLK